MSTPVLRYGADYNPDQWLHRPDILAQDIELMKKANVNVVSLGIFAWATLEPAEGEYNLDWMAKIIDDLYAAGVSVDLATPSGARPAWMTRKYPEVLRVGSNRQRNLFGERHNHCYTSPVYRQKVKLINQKLAARFGRHPGVIMWHISNEYGGECHCEKCQQAFRDWLKAKYGTIEALNRAWNAKFWSHDYPDFDAVESPAPHGENSVHGLKLDWKRFVSHQTIDFMKWERDCIREIVPEAKVCTNMMYFYDGIDYFAMAKELDLATWDAYPTWHKPTETMEQTAMDTGFMHDLIYSVKGQPFWLMENCPGPTNWQPISKGKKPGVNIMAGMQTVAHGGDGVLFFQWRQAQGSSEKFHAAMVSHDCRDDNRIYLECAELGSMLKELSADIAGTKREKQAAIVYDWSNKWALEDAQGPRNKGLSFKHELLRHYTGLKQNGIDVQMICEDSDISGYKLGDEIKCDVFAEGDKIDAIGISKGHGYTGTIQRWNMHTGPMSHGSKYHRGVGSLSANSDPSRVFKNKKMAGQYGGERVTIQNLEIVKVDAERNLIMIKGAIPGANGSLVMVRDAVKA